MRLAFIHNRPIGAAEANVGAVVQQAAAFARAGLEVHLTAYRGGDGGDPFARHAVGGEVHLRLVEERRGALSYPALLLAGLKAGGEVVYTRVPQIALYAVASGRRAILEMHTPVGALRRSRSLIRALNLAAPRLRGVVTISPALQGTLQAEIPRYAGPWVVAPSAAADLLAPADAPAPDHDLGYVGGLTPGKGADMVLEIARRLPDARVLLAGDVRRHPELGARAAALANVTVLGPVAPAEVAGVMARFRIGLAPYGASVTGAGGSGMDLARWMSPLKLAEYASAGKAILAADLPAVRAMLAPGEARLAPPGDLPAWTAAARGLLAGPAEREALAAAARAAYLQRFSWDGRARRIIEACRL